MPNTSKNGYVRWPAFFSLVGAIGIGIVTLIININSDDIEIREFAQYEKRVDEKFYQLEKRMDDKFNVVLEAIRDLKK